MFSSNQSNVAVVPNYIEDVFSTWLYTGNSGSQTVTNNINLSTNGGLTWIKSRSAATDHKLTDTARGVTKALISDTTGAQTTDTTGLTAFGTTGFTIGANTDYNNSGYTYASWTFRKQAKFFDVVTYAGTGTTQNIAHSLGSAPGFIITKNVTASGSWWCFHTSLGNATAIRLNSTAASNADANIWNSTTPTSTQFTVGASSSSNESGETFVAYLFAHNAGGFGLTGTDNVISCGSFTTDGSGGATVSLGYEPQWVMTKSSTTTTDWRMFDNMRGMSMTSDNLLRANTSGAESTGDDYINPTATGFVIPANGNYSASQTFIYIAIRRGPMKVPTDATKVFSPVYQTGGGTVTTNFPVDLALSTSSGNDKEAMDRLRGGTTTYYNYLSTNSTSAEASGTGAGFGFDNNTGYVDNGWWSGPNVIYWNFQRAPSFFDEVCYTGNGSATAITHNLGVAPQFIITKTRSGAGAWRCGANFTSTDYTGTIRLNSDFDGPTESYSNTGVFAAAPTSTTFTAGSPYYASGVTYVAYLFATCAGVSKVGSYTGNGTTQTINCGFTGGARFVLIKRTDSTGDWYVYDTARGMTVLTDPYLLLNTTAAQTATLGSVTTVTTGFALNSSILAAINISSATYIFLAIA